MELVVAVAIAVLTLIFIGSLIVLVLICRQRYCFHEMDQKPILKYSKENLEAIGQQDLIVEYELDDVLQLSPNIEKVLRDNDWINDATGLVQHCLAILRLCHNVADKLSSTSFSPIHCDQESMEELRQATRRVMPRVDDLIRAMYLDGRKGVQTPLLEARAAALVLVINNLALTFRSAFPVKRVDQKDWLRTSLVDMELQLAALRDASQSEEHQQLERVEFFAPNSSAVATDSLLTSTATSATAAV